MLNVMPAAGEFPTEVYLARVSGVIVDNQSQRGLLGLPGMQRYNGGAARREAFLPGNQLGYLRFAIHLLTRIFGRVHGLMKTSSLLSSLSSTIRYV